MFFQNGLFICLSILGYIVNSQEIIEQVNITEAYYSGAPMIISASENFPNYVQMSLCNQQHLGEKNQLKLTFEVGGSTKCSTNGATYVIIQISKVKDVWNASTVIAQNYELQNSLPQKCNYQLVWNMDPTIKELYIRMRAVGGQPKTSWILRYTDGEKVDVNAYTGTSLWSGNQKINGEYLSMKQYFRSDDSITIPNDQKTLALLSLNYCAQSNYPIRGMNVAISADKSTPNALFVQGACPKTVSNISDCYPYSAVYDLENPNEVPFNFEAYSSTQSLNMQVGLFVWVAARGGEPNEKNTFDFNADVIY